jgi:PiT family inorganic phosphate transporter
MDLYLVFTVVVVALVFEYINGFHDTANSIATVVGTKVLTPRQAIILAACTNLLGAFFGLAVAKTISSGLVVDSFVTQPVLICALFGAIFWNLLTWWYGIPSSSTHALVGGLTGAVLAAAVCMNSATPLADKDGKPVSVWSSIKWSEVKEKKSKYLVDPTPELLAVLGDSIKTNGTHTVKVGTNKVSAVVFCGKVQQVAEKSKLEKSGVLHKVIIPMVTSPVIGFVGGLILMTVLYGLLRSWRPVTVNRTFGKLQLVSAGYMGFSHGMNDATKTMGIITLALVAATKSGDLSAVPAFFGFLTTPEGSDPLHLSLGDQLISILPTWLHFGYMPAIGDAKSQGVPYWVVFTCAVTMAAGTAAGGWKIIKTMGHKMVKLQPVHGFAAETTAATVLAVTGSLGMPVSTTHAITTSIMGVGCAKRFSALKLKVIEKILWAWVLTIPATAGVAFGLVWAMNKIGWIKF